MHRRMARFLSVFMLSLIMFTCMSTVAFAASSFKIGDADADLFEDMLGRKELQIPLYTGIDLDIQGVPSEDNDDIYVPLFKTSDVGDDGRFFFNRVDFAKLTKKEQEKLLQKFVTELNQSEISAGGRRKIYNSIKDTVDPVLATALPRLVEESTPNVFKGLSVLRPFTGVVGTILGVAVILLVLFMVLCTVVDLAWMNISVFQNFSTGKANEHGAKKPLFASMDAVIAVKDATEGMTEHKNTNYNLIYFKRRVVSYILVAICILYLLSGQIADLIVWLFDIARTIVPQ